MLFLELRSIIAFSFLWIFPFSAQASKCGDLFAGKKVSWKDTVTEWSMDSGGPTVRKGTIIYDANGKEYKVTSVFEATIVSHTKGEFRENKISVPTVENRRGVRISGRKFLWENEIFVSPESGLREYISVLRGNGWKPARILGTGIKAGQLVRQMTGNQDALQVYSHRFKNGQAIRWELVPETLRYFINNQVYMFAPPGGEGPLVRDRYYNWTRPVRSFKNPKPKEGEPEILIETRPSLDEGHDPLLDVTSDFYVPVRMEQRYIDRDGSHYAIVALKVKSDHEKNPTYLMKSRKGKILELPWTQISSDRFLQWESLPNYKKFKVGAFVKSADGRTFEITSILKKNAEESRGEDSEGNLGGSQGGSQGGKWKESEVVLVEKDSTEHSPDSCFVKETSVISTVIDTRTDELHKFSIYGKNTEGRVALQSEKNRLDIRIIEKAEFADQYLVVLDPMSQTYFVRGEKVVISSSHKSPGGGSSVVEGVIARPWMRESDQTIIYEVKLEDGSGRRLILPVERLAPLNK